MLVHDAIHIIMMQYWIAVLEKIVTGAIHSVSGYSTGIQMHMNTAIEKLHRSEIFSSVRIQYQCTGLVYSTGCTVYRSIFRYFNHY